MSILQEYRISEIAEVIGGGTPDTKDESLWNGDIAWITPADLSKNKEKYFKIGERNITQKGLKESSTRLLPKGTVLLSSRAPIGYLAIAANSICTNQGFKSLVCYTDIVSNEYLYYFLLLQRDYLETISSGATFPELSGGTLKKLKILLPPLPAQQRIASILSAYDDLVEVNNQRIKLLEETARELYKEWFVRMRFPGYKKAKFLKGVPEGWEVKRIAEVFEVLGGGTPSTEKSEYWSENVNWFTPTDITGASGIFLSESSNKISEKGLKESSAKLFPAYSIMMTSRATIGAVGINTTPGCTNQGFITCLPNNNLPYTFLYFWVLLNKEVFEMLGTGSTFLEITKGTFRKIKMLLPKLEVLNQFHKLSEPMFQQIEILQQQNIQLRQIRDRLLPRLISGKLEVKGKRIFTKLKQN